MSQIFLFIRDRQFVNQSSGRICEKVQVITLKEVSQLLMPSVIESLWIRFLPVIIEFILFYDLSSLKQKQQQQN